MRCSISSAHVFSTSEIGDCSVIRAKSRRASLDPRPIERGPVRGSASGKRYMYSRPNVESTSSGGIRIDPRLVLKFRKPVAPHRSALARRAAAFIDRPHDQALTATAIARRKHALNARRELSRDFRPSPFVRASVSSAKSFSSICSGPKKPIASNTSCAGCVFSVPGTSTGMNWPLSFFCQPTCTVTTLFHVAVLIAAEALHRREIRARIRAELRRGLFLAVVHLVDLRPLRPRIVFGAIHRRLLP